MSRATTGDVSSTEGGVFFVQLSRARQHVQEERYDVARKELELALLARPNDEDVLNLLSVIEFKRGYYNEAAQASRALLKNNPASAVLHSNLGLILFKAGVLGEAEDELRRALDLQPDHVRSHLYLGLLYRMRGKLGLALEHLRFAGAKRVVGEIEEALRKSMREPASRAGADAAARSGGGAASPTSSILSPSILKLAQPAPSEAGPRFTAPAPAQAPAGATIPEAPADDTPGAEFLEETVRVVDVPVVPPGPPVAESVIDDAPEEPAAVDEALTAAMLAPFPEADSGAPQGAPAPPAVPETAAPDPAAAPPPFAGVADSHPLFHVRSDGGLEVASRGIVFVRKGSVVWYSGKMRFAAEPTFRGSRLEKILRADGRGHLFVNDPGRQAVRRDLVGEALYVEGSRILALDQGLSFRLEPIHDFRVNRRVDVLKIHGRGSVILSVGGPLLSHVVSTEFPLNVSSRDLVAWTGDLVPSVLEDRFLEEVMMPDVGSAPKIRFEGEGMVLTEPPRPRRRASDLARAGDSDRRS